MERPYRPRPSRTGFTLVELLVVILIIATLLALLVPAVAGAFRRAKEAQVAAELNNIATALASFKTTYNDYPPSRMLMAEGGYTPALLNNSTKLVTLGIAHVPSGDSNVSDMTIGQLAQRSLSILRKFWPRCDFTGSDANYFNDFNGNGGSADANYVIAGSECLTFFLGGLPLFDSTSTPKLVTGLSGFSKLPTHPFVALSPAGVAYYNATTMNQLSHSVSNRTVPNYEFNNGRLIDSDGNNIPSYIDPLDTSILNQREYAYFSSYGNNSYDPNDVNGNGPKADPPYEQEEDGSTYVERGFNVSFPPNSVVSPGPNPYTSGNPAAGSQSWINPNSFQIICAGQDRQFGLGGTYAQTSVAGTGKLPILLKTSDPGNIHGDVTTNVRLRESDNITNFSGGRLD